MKDIISSGFAPADVAPSRLHPQALPKGSIVAPFGGSYLESYGGYPKKELLWSLGV